MKKNTLTQYPKTHLPLANHEADSKAPIVHSKGSFQSLEAHLKFDVNSFKVDCQGGAVHLNNEKNNK